MNNKKKTNIKKNLKQNKKRKVLIASLSALSIVGVAGITTAVVLVSPPPTNNRNPQEPTINKELLANRKLFYTSNDGTLLDFNKYVFNNEIIFHNEINDIKVIDETKMFQTMFDDSITKVVLPSSLQELVITSTNDLSKFDFSNCKNLKSISIDIKQDLDLSKLDVPSLNSLEKISIIANTFNLDYVNNSKLPNLKSLHFEYLGWKNTMTFFNPNDFLNLTELSFKTDVFNTSSIDLSNNKNLRTLKINLGNWNWSSTQYPTLGDNVNYEEISIITDIPPTQTVVNWNDFKKQTNLKKLSLRSSKSSATTDYGNFDFSNLKNLEYLFVEAGEGILNWEKLFVPDNFPKLKELHVKQRYLGVDDWWNKFTNLETIHIEDQESNSNWNMDISKIDFSKFTNLKNFTFKTVSDLNVNIDFTNVDANHFFKNLQTLELQAPNITFNNLLKNPSLYKNLQSLIINTKDNFDFLNDIKNSNINYIDLGLEPLADNQSRTLDLSNFKSLNEIKFSKFFKDSNNKNSLFTTLNLSNNNIDNLILNDYVFNNIQLDNLILDNAQINTLYLANSFKNYSFNNSKINYLNYQNNLNQNFNVNEISNLKWFVSNNDLIWNFDLSKQSLLETISISNNANVSSLNLSNLLNLNSLSIYKCNPNLNVDTSTNKNLEYKFISN